MFNRARVVFSAWLCFASLFLAGPLRAESQDTLGPGDSVRVTVFQNPNLTTEARISPRGSIWMPLIGDVDLKGLTQGEAVARIAGKLKDGQFLNDPQVSISVLTVRSPQVSVLGQVQRPGRYPLDDTGNRLTDVLAQAGGLAPEGDNLISVISTENGKTTKREIDLTRIYREVDSAANIELKGGDTVVVERSPVFYIYGQVQRAGAYRLAENLSVMQAISLAGGVTPRGTERGIKIHRRGAEGNVQDIASQVSDVVRANDVIYIQESMF